MGTDVQQGEPESVNEPKRSAQPLDRVARTADPDNTKDASGRDPYSDYRTLMALMGPRQHRYLHFGRKKALPLYSDVPIDQVEGSDDYIGDDYDASSAESLEDAMRWAKPYLGDGLHEDVVLSGAPEDGEVIREEGYPYENTLTSDMHLGDRILHFGKQEPHHQDADFLNKRSTANADLQFDNEYSESPYLVDKKITNRILHFGKRLDGSAEDPGKVSGKSKQDVPSVNSDIKFEDSFLVEEHKPHNRRKRSLGFDQYDLDETLERVVHQLMDAGYPKRVALAHPGIPGHLHLPHAFVAAHVYGSELPRMLSRPSRSDRFFPVPYSGEHREAPKGPSRNVFLHFG
ncbi:hypothetical protein IscW_ISCW012656 [Ixodes scapularis]|uniref:Uncharacterized protein n=1 Tax=Ixodes scapularis TaxID=6945 RepID=B7QE73_IXOSC|nr:hypothetical protein IscW_ISCW012656 [Ixodes scapularis]|eukprot:XP_002413837.1 hypothetical protein IscW_ISCW012656 [Ixodes scapularis]